MFYILRRRQPAPYATPVWPNIWLTVWLIVAGCHSVLDQSAPSSNRSGAARSPTPPAARTTWQRWPDDQSGEPSASAETAKQPTDGASSRDRDGRKHGPATADPSTGRVDPPVHSSSSSASPTQQDLDGPELESPSVISDTSQNDASLVESLSSSDEGLRVAAVRKWSSATTEPLPEQVVAMINDDRQNVRIAALQAVASHGHVAAMPQVLQASKDHDLHVRLEAIRVLGELGTNEARAQLVQILKQGTERPRMEAIGALARAGDMGTVYASVSDPSWRVRREIAAELAHDHSPRSKEVASTLLRDNSIEVAAKVIESLGSWPIQNAAGLLLDATDSRAGKIRHAAMAQLAQCWESAQALTSPMTDERRRDLLTRLRHLCTTEFENGAPGRREIENADSAGPDGKRGEGEIPEEQLVRAEAYLRAYLDAVTDEARSAWHKKLTENGPVLITICQRIALERQQPLENRVYRELLAAVDPHFATIQRLSEDDLARRREAAKTLAQLSQQRPLGRLALYRLAAVVIAEPDTEVWRSILDVMGPYDSEPARRLAYAATSHPSSDIRRRACEYMRQQSSTEHARILMPLLRDSDISVVGAAIQALGTCESLPQVGPLKQFLLSPDKTLRVEAAVALTRVGSANGPAALERLSYDSDESVRRRVATVLGELNDPSYTSTLIRLLDDQPSVRRAALDALPKIVESPLASEPGTPEALARQWKDWHRQHGQSLR